MDPKSTPTEEGCAHADTTQPREANYNPQIFQSTCTAHPGRWLSYFMFFWCHYVEKWIHKIMNNGFRRILQNGDLNEHFWCELMDLWNQWEDIPRGERIPCVLADETYSAFLRPGCVTGPIFNNTSNELKKIHPRDSKPRLAGRASSYLSCTRVKDNKYKVYHCAYPNS